jgi:paraquat-inducible protein B
VGAFVVGAVVLVVAAILTFGSGKLLRQKFTHVIYFEGSVKGLTIGAPVSFRGVQVGEVTRIGAYGEVGPQDFYIEVRCVIYPDVVQTRVPEITPQDYYHEIDLLVEKGLRARLETQSLITGQRYISLEFYPDAPILHAAIDPALHEIPAVPTATQELRKTVDRVMIAIDEMPIEEILDEFRRALTGIERLATAPELLEAVVSVERSMDALTDLAVNLDATAESITSRLDESTRGLQETLEAAQLTLEELRHATATGMVAHYQVLDDLSDALESLRVLTEYLEQHPEALLTGRGEGGN